MSNALIATVLLLAFTVPARCQESRTPVAASPETLLARALTEPTPSMATIDDLHRAWLAVSGEGQPLAAALGARIDDPAVDAEQRARARRLLAQILHREGRLAEAARALEALPTSDRDGATRLLGAHLIDATGSKAEAVAAWEALRADARDPELRAHVEVRRALLDERPRPASADRPAVRPPSATRPVSRPARPSSESRGSPLFLLAAVDGADPEFRNRAAIVLAVLGNPDEATQLYRPVGEGRDLFREEVRLAEWALASNRLDDARDHGWLASRAATTKRDRLYALTVTVEAARAGGQIQTLIDRLAATRDLDAESRQTWIDLLRETSQVDAAMALFRGSVAGGFTSDMRRQLLEMCREAGRDADLVREYQQLIVDEPDRLEWREGLARHALETGDRAAALRVFEDLIARTTDPVRRMAAAESARDLGLDEIARSTANLCLRSGSGQGEARLFLAELERTAGRVDGAVAELDALDREAPPTDAIRVRLGEAFERIGNKKRAIDIMEGLRARRGGDDAEEDLEMRLAWLLSEVGNEDLALERWRNLWHRVNSIPRRRQIEDRLMATASRLGKLGDLAVELEEKLANGTADDRDAGLLTRLYIKVNDAVSATEIATERIKKKSGLDPVAVLEEQAQVYLACKDYFHFEKATRELATIDVERRGDHLRRLAMSNLERGRPEEARGVLTKLAEVENPSDAAEFEAGVLALAGLNAEAARAYRRGLARHPERIDGWLLLANAMRDVGQTDRAIGIFQYLAETADRDDLFTVAIDGLLNMRAPPAILNWARRITLERITRRHDRLYLYQLYSDLSDEVKDAAGVRRALENALPIAAEQRGAILRELMDGARGTATGSFMLLNGSMTQRTAGGNEVRRLAYGRRLIGLGEIMPPQVYLDLGEAFLRLGDVVSATKTFGRARDVTDWASFERQVAKTFEESGFVEAAVGVYERAMASGGTDVGLMAQVAELREQLGQDGRAADLYARAVAILLAQQPLRGDAPADQRAADEVVRWTPRNLDDFEKHFDRCERGLLAAADGARLEAVLVSERRALDVDLARVAGMAGEAPEARRIAARPRVLKRSASLRRLLLGTGRVEAADDLDAALFAVFPGDGALLESACRERVSRGREGAARTLATRSAVAPESRAVVLARIGLAGDSAGRSRRPPDAVARIGPLLMQGDVQKAALALRTLGPLDVSKDDLGFLDLLVSAAVHVREESAIVQLTNQAARAFARHATTWQDRDKAIAILDRARKALPAAAFDGIVDGFVAVVSANEKEFSGWSYLLQDLQARCGRPLLSAETVKKQVDAALPARPFVLPGMLALAPSAARASIVESAWNKVPPTQRFMYASMILDSGDDNPPPPELVNFLLQALEEAATTVDEPASIVYELGNLLETGVCEPAALLRLAEALNTRKPGNGPLGVILAAARLRAGDRPGALMALKLSASATPEVQKAYMLTRAVEAFVQSVDAADATALARDIEAERDQRSASTHLGRIEVELLRKVKDVEARRAALEAFVKADAKRVDALEDLVTLAIARGDAPGELMLRTKLVAADTNKARRRRELETFWTARRDPVRAKSAGAAARRAVAAGSDASGDDADSEDLPQDSAAELDDRKLPPASARTLKDALAAGQDDRARSIYRRLWRRYGDRSFVGMVFASSFDMAFPSDPLVTKRSRGGLDDLGLDTDTAKPKVVRTIHEAIAERPWGLDELRRVVAGSESTAGRSSDGVLRALAAAESRAGLSETEEAARRLRLDAATSGTIDRRQLIQAIDARGTALTEAERHVADALARAADPLDPAQIVAVARVLGRSGDAERASRMFDWSATLTGGGEGSRFAFALAQSGGLDTLVEQASAVLAGDRLAQLCDSIFTRTDPGESPARDHHDALALSTFEKVFGPEAALARSAERLARIRSAARYPEPNAALAAARVLARCGRVDEAVAMAELGMCRPTAPESRLSRRDRSRALVLARNNPVEREGARTLLRKAEGPWTNLPEFLRKLGESALIWAASDRMDEDAARRLLAIVAVRLHEVGDDAGAAPCVARVQMTAPKSGAAAYLSIDLLRLTGHEPEARALEDALLAEGRLHLERVPGVVARLQATVGDLPAFTAAESAAAWTAHPDLIGLLIELSTKLRNTARADHWRKVQTDARAAAAEQKRAW